MLQVGDLVEGLCGSEELARLQNNEAVDFVKQSKLGVPFVFTKGNHDVTGDGAIAAFDDTLLPYLRSEAANIDANAIHHGANGSLRTGNSQIVLFDAYDRSSLDWFEATIASRTTQHLFFVVHPPIVPYGARAPGIFTRTTSQPRAASSFSNSSRNKKRLF